VSASETTTGARSATRHGARAEQPAIPTGDAVASAAAHAQRSPQITRRRELVWQDPLPTAAEGAGMSGIDYIRVVAAGELPPPPIAVLLRMGPTRIEEGSVSFEGAPGEEHYNPIGVVHGGYAATLLDSALGCAVHTTLPAGVGYTSLTLEVKYVRPITRETGKVRAEAEVVHRGRRQATAEARLLEAETGKLLAHGTGTCLIVGS
jgi:uncharacterized protein (TIGR00369 family)